MPESVSEPSTTSQPGTAHSITCDCPKQRAVLRMLAFVIGGLFLFSAYAKLAGINAFEVYLVKEGLMPNRSVAAVFSRLLIGFEGLIGLAFFFKNGLRKVTSIVALIMLGVFSIFLAIQAAKGNSDSCHCFGELLPMSAGQSLGKNIAMMAGIGWVMYRSRSWNVGSCPFGKPVILAIIAVGFLGGPFLLKPMASFNPAPNPPIQADPDVPEKPSRFAQFNQFEPEVSPITEGKVLVIFVSLDCEHCRELVTKLSFATDRNQHPHTHGFYPPTLETVANIKKNQKCRLTLKAH